MDAKILYNFKDKTNLRGWTVVDDIVMGGRSNGYFDSDKNGNGHFTGFVSLENYGGFSSVRYKNSNLSVKPYNYIVIKTLGDNKNYQFRVKSKSYHRHQYVKEFFARDEWQEVRIRLDSMKPYFRGRKLDMDNFNHTVITELGILIGNKVEEQFSLRIDSISLE